MPDYKILIVEDDAVIAQSEKEHLKKWNFTVYCAENFKEITLINIASLEEYNQSVPKEERLDALKNGYVWILDNTGKISDGDKFSITPE